MEEKFSIGDVVFSKMGRDSGRHYIVVATEENFVYICDGDLHKSDKPKKKKNKHIKPVGKRNEYIIAKLSEEGRVTNNELRRAIAEVEEEINS